MSQPVSKSKPWKTVICISNGWKTSRIPAVQDTWWRKTTAGKRDFHKSTEAVYYIPTGTKLRSGAEGVQLRRLLHSVSTVQPAPINFTSTRNQVRMPDQPYYNLPFKFFTYSNRFYTWRWLNKGHWNFSYMHTVSTSTLPAKRLEIAAGFNLNVTAQHSKLLIQQQTAKKIFPNQGRRTTGPHQSFCVWSLRYMWFFSVLVPAPPNNWLCQWTAVLSLQQTGIQMWKLLTRKVQHPSKLSSVVNPSIPNLYCNRHA